MTDLLTEKLKIGPKDGVVYPIHVQYCGNCTMPIEFCSFYPEYEKCKKWLEENLPTEFSKLEVKNSTEAKDAGAGDDEEKKRQKRGGKGMIKPNKKKEPTDKDKKIFVSRAPRGKKKSVTVVSGLGSYGIDLKLAAKFFGSKFACGSSVTGDDEIVIQGDVKDELFDVIPEKWPVDEENIEDLGDLKR